MIFNMSGGGGSGGRANLNFKIISGTSAPASPVENDIWVNTDAEITSWTFSADEPVSIADGALWISVGKASPVAFNALMENGIMVYPLSVKQYGGGAWASKEAKSYINGEWVDWVIYLYNNGDVCADVSGGFKAYPYKPDKYNGSSVIVPTLNLKSDYMEITEPAQYYGQVFNETAFAVDELSEIEVAYSNASDGINLGVTSTNTHGFSLAASVTPEAGEGTAIIDVSALSGKYYFAVSMLNSNVPKTLNIHEIMLR